MLHLLACWCFLDEKHRQAISSFFVGRIRPSNIRMVVVLPAPLGPRNPKTVPAETVRFKVSTARCGPKCLESPFISIARGVAPFALVICIVYSFFLTRCVLSDGIADDNLTAFRHGTWNTSPILFGGATARATPPLCAFRPGPEASLLVEVPR